MVFNLEDLQREYLQGNMYEYVFFWGHTPAQVGRVDGSCFSQWWQCEFTVDGVNYNSAEQYMMAEKARLFGDTKVEQKVLQVLHPKEIKALGRLVKGFNAEVWDANCFEIVKKGNMAKFTQNPTLLSYLLATKNKILVEASPVDKIWGIGMDKNNINSGNPMAWEGKNLLGFALTAVREALI